MKRLWKLVRIALVAYLLVLLMLAWLENFFIFPTSAIPPGDWSPAAFAYEDAWFESADGTRLHGWLLAHPEPRGYLLFCHGNAENVAHTAPELDRLRRKLGLSIFVFDYRGYGRSDGRPHEAGVLADAHAARAWLVERAGIRPDDIILSGRSLGGAVAVDLAAHGGARGLILERTFTSMTDVAARHFPWAPVRWLMKTKLDSRSKISLYTGPVLQCHGTADEIVDFDIARALFDAVPTREKTFVAMEGLGHNDPDAPEYAARRSQFIAGLAPGD